MNITRPAWIEVNLDNIVHNVKTIWELAKKDANREIECMPILKCGAYGHGIFEVAKILYENGISNFGVAMYSEALLLRKVVRQATILILGYTPNYLIDKVIENSITQSVYTYEQAEFFSKRAKYLGKNLSVHIKLDTGMHRLGFKCNDESVKAVKKIYELPNLKVEGIFTHFATSGMKEKEYVYLQYKRFRGFIKKLEDNRVEIPIKHISNTGIILDSPELHQDMIRVGTMVYGTYTSDDVKKERVQLRDAVSVKAEISQVKYLEAGKGISYDLTYVTKRKTNIATLPIGYGDIVVRKLSNKGYVLVKGIKSPIVGRVCMDQMLIDVTGIDVKMGDTVTLIGEDNGNIITIKEIADLLGIDSYEFLCSINRRLPIKYIRNGKVIRIIDLNVELSNSLFHI